MLELSIPDSHVQEDSVSSKALPYYSQHNGSPPCLLWFVLLAAEVVYSRGLLIVSHHTRKLAHPH